MTEKFVIQTLSEAVNDIILPKFKKYIEDRRNDISLQDRINAIVDKIDDYESLVNDLVNDLGEDFKGNIRLDEYGFEYNQELDTYVYCEDKLETAKLKIWREDGLVSDTWCDHKDRLIKNRIAAIITTLEETSFDEIVKIVESQIDFNEFIVKQ